MLEYSEILPKKFILMNGAPYEVLDAHVFRNTSASASATADGTGAPFLVLLSMAPGASVETVPLHDALKTFSFGDRRYGNEVAL